MWALRGMKNQINWQYNNSFFRLEIFCGLKNKFIKKKNMKGVRSQKIAPKLGIKRVKQAGKQVGNFKH